MSTGESLAVGERRASAVYGTAIGPDGEAPADATWLVEEWTGVVWRRVTEVVGTAERDRLLQRV